MTPDLLEVPVEIPVATLGCLSPLSLDSMTAPDPHWTAYLQALLTSVVAALAAFIAWRQWLTARNKLKLDLFDRRFAVYDAARNLIGSIATSGKVKEDELMKYLLGTREVRWLLNKDIEEYLWGIYLEAVNHQSTDDELNFANPGDRPRLAQVKAAQRKALLQKLEGLDEKFSEFLSLGH